MRIVGLAADVRPAANRIADGVEVVRKSKDGRSLLFVLNHTPDPRLVLLPGKHHDLLSGRDLNGETALEKYEVLILTEE